MELQLLPGDVRLGRAARRCDAAVGARGNEIDRHGFLRFMYSIAHTVPAMVSTTNNPKQQQMPTRAWPTLIPIGVFPSMPPMVAIPAAERKSDAAGKARGLAEGQERCIGRGTPEGCGGPLKSAGGSCQR